MALAGGGGITAENMPRVEWVLPGVGFMRLASPKRGRNLAAFTLQPVCRPPCPLTGKRAKYLT